MSRCAIALVADMQEDGFGGEVKLSDVEGGINALEYWFEKDSLHLIYPSLVEADNLERLGLELAIRGFCVHKVQGYELTLSDSWVDAILAQVDCACFIDLESLANHDIVVDTITDLVLERGSFFWRGNLGGRGQVGAIGRDFWEIERRTRGLEMAMRPFWSYFEFAARRRCRAVGVEPLIEGGYGERAMTEPRRSQSPAIVERGEAISAAFDLNGDVRSTSGGRNVLCFGVRSGIVSGGDRALANLAEAASFGDRKWTLAVPSTNGQLVSVWKQAGHSVVLCAMLARISAWSSSVAVGEASRMGRYANKNGVGVVLSGNLASTRIAGMVAGLISVPLVARIVSRCSWWELDIAEIWRASRIVVPSVYIQKHCVGLGVPEGLIDVVHEAVGRSYGEMEGDSSELFLTCTGEDVLVGVVGRLDDPIKRLDVVLQVALRTVRVNPRVRFVICGGTKWHDGPPQWALQFVKAFGLESSVQFVGRTAGMSTWNKKFDMLLHAASAEPFGLVIAEAMAAGVPIVGVNSGGVPEQVSHSVNGLLTMNSDAVELSEAVLQLASNSEMRRWLGENGRNASRDLHSIDRFGRRMESIIARSIREYTGNVRRLPEY